MASVFIKIEGIEDGALDAPEDVALALRAIAERMMDGATRGLLGFTEIPEAGWADEDEPPEWWFSTDRY